MLQFYPEIWQYFRNPKESTEENWYIKLVINNYDDMNAEITGNLTVC